MGSRAQRLGRILHVSGLSIEAAWNTSCGGLVHRGWVEWRAKAERLGGIVH